MKKIEKLRINPEKIMKQEELISLRGGYDYYSWTCIVRCATYSEDQFHMSNEYPEEWMAAGDCINFFQGEFGPCNCMCDRL